MACFSALGVRVLEAPRFRREVIVYVLIHTETILSVCELVLQKSLNRLGAKKPKHDKS
jgi:hypothetical protein